MIDIVIPVYRGLEATRRCIDSVLAAACSEHTEIVVVDDASPEPEISAWLRSLAGAGRITLLTHAENRGFVASVNEAMALHAARDVVLLNSDTEVADGWLDRLAACARREPSVATVTPFTNNGTICGYPRFSQSNPLPAGMTVGAVDAIFARVNATVAVDIPVGVGFCMYVTRHALERLGLFDAATFGRGYGEEVDFCMRARRAGLRNLLCADVFVFHEGEVSFGAGAPGIRGRAQAIIDERYPEFRAAVAEFVAREPLRQYRRRVDVARLQSGSRPRVLMVSHAWGGGVEQHVQALAAMLAKECEVLSMGPEGDGHVTVSWLREGEEFQAWFDTGSEWEACLEVLRAIGIDRVHYHHIHRLPQQALDIAHELGVPYDVTLHDYFPICPRYHMADIAGEYCGEHGEDGCRRCLEKGPAQWPLTLDQWRSLFHAWLLGAARVIAPSHDVAARIRRYFADVPVNVWAHPEFPRDARPVFKVALLGGMSAIKGARMLEDCARDAAARDLPLHFHVIGHVDRPMETYPRAPLTIGGSYEDRNLAHLIELERPDAFLFLSRVPETYSYTLTAAMNAGLPVVCPSLGAFPERLQGYAMQAMFPIDATAAQINDLLVARLQASGRMARGAAAVAGAR